MATFELTKENLQSSIEDNEVLLVDFWAEWCGPCRMFAPVFEKASDAHPDVAFAKCDTEHQPEVAAAFDVQSIPTLAVFRDQVLVFLQPGALSPQALEAIIEQVKQLDMDEVRQKVAAHQPGAEQGPADEPGPDRPTEPASTQKVVEPRGAGGKAAGRLITSEERSGGLSHLADDPVLRRQGVTREFIANVRSAAVSPSAQRVASKVLEMYESLHNLIRERGAQGRAQATEQVQRWDFDPEVALAELDAETRSEVRAVLRAIEELLGD